MKKLTLIILILLLSLPLFSKDGQSVEFSVGIRESATEDAMPTVGAIYSTKYFDLGLRIHTPSQFDVAASFNLTLLEVIKQNAHLHLTQINDNGGTLSFSYGIGPELYLLNDYVLLGLMIKGQAALGWAKYSEYLPFGLSLDAKAYVGFNGNIFDFNTYISFSTFFDRVWKAAPIVGVNASYRINKDFKVGIYANVFFADYTAGSYPAPTITGGTAGVFCRWSI